MEHLQHFGLGQDPFQNEPDLRFYFESRSHSDAQRRVERALRQSKGLSVLCGEPGTGRSLLARRILDGLEEELFDTSLMVAVKASSGSGSLIGRFARQLEIAEPADDPGALMGQVYEALAVIREDGRHAVLIVDEAHVLSSEAFSEVGSLLNLEYEERRLLSLLLVGPPELDAALEREPGLLQRVDVRVRLQPLDLSDTARYIAHRLQASGGSAAIVPQDALEALFKLSRGRPRLINTLADNALFEAFLGGRAAVSPVDVERAAGDLGVGADPGTTYTAFGQTESACAPPAAGASHATVIGGGGMPQRIELDALDPPEPPAELDALLDSAEGVGDEGLTRIHLGSENDELELSSPTASSGSLPSFEAQNSQAPAEAEATRLALPDEDPDAGDDGQIDDLFVELLDD